MIKQMLERRVGHLSNDEFKEVMDIVTDDIKFNRINFSKRTNKIELIEIAERSLQALRRMELEYDRYGRAKYNPFIHRNTGKPWSNTDLNYLINWYDIIGPDEMSFALERTIATVMNKVYTLRKKGVMDKHKRIRNCKRVRSMH
ncbi:hypothetical protein phiCT453A_11 (endogenous virus) [Clostridium phage phiCT453A]|uniref:hypothetical protein n=1 Tax=Clostridium phage phiCT453A TaxID=1567012 RepID=UPI000572A871|nr:hypothetical protein [Clostridium tetani]YP_009216655.1 hypothetical protein phiCT453A_11 [Clostridium phage phiCT453A]AJA42501.1 hypothetical protein phiCT453A_11 [Clostridium phage phiCT453A]